MKDAVMSLESDLSRLLGTYKRKPNKLRYLYSTSKLKKQHFCRRQKSDVYIINRVVPVSRVPLSAASANPAFTFMEQGDRDQEDRCGRGSIWIN